MSMSHTVQLSLPNKYLDRSDLDLYLYIDKEQMATNYRKGFIKAILSEYQSHT